ncbi:hypothetical protein ACFLUH_01530 [Chloroflexota bacterium]
MAFYRMYTGDDEKSHIEELNLATNTEMKSLQAAKGIIFSETPSGNFIDWHPAPRRQYIIQLSGQVEIGLPDGTTVRYYPGDTRLVEDTTGQGHTTRVISDGPSITATIHLA